METELWTLAELADRVAGALSSGYGGQQSGRVSDVPDTRAIRYYTTLGLLDRPTEMRGRTAYYGPRHLWQLVAIKRLQAGGSTLAEIQRELAAAPDSTLKRLADIPDDSFWRRVPAVVGTGPHPSKPKPEAPQPAVPAAETTAYQAIPLDSGAIVLIPHAAGLTDDDIAALRTAAGSLDAAIAQLTTGPTPNVPKGQS
jgi:DNA-binding transcriptional MerR regulator